MGEERLVSNANGLEQGARESDNGDVAEEVVRQVAGCLADVPACEQLKPHWLLLDHLTAGNVLAPLAPQPQ